MDKKKNGLLNQEEEKSDVEIIGEQTASFLELAYPCYLVNPHQMENLLEKDSTSHLQNMTFFRIAGCNAEHTDSLFEYLNERFEKLLTALHSIGVPIAYGVVSQEGITNLVLGVSPEGDAESVKAITRGMLSGLEMREIAPNFSIDKKDKRSHGILAGVPSLFVKEQKQHFSLASVMRSLNGQNYTLLFLAKPVIKEKISEKISDLINVRDKAFAVSKGSISHAVDRTTNETTTETDTEGRNNIDGAIGGNFAAIIGAIIGLLSGKTAIAMAIGTALGNNVGTLLGNIIGQGEFHSNSYSSSLSKSISNSVSIFKEYQNGFALELMSYADNAIERLKGGQNNGMWQTAIVYSAENAMARNVIQACLKGELSKTDSEKLPMLAFQPLESGEALKVPKFLKEDCENSLCSYLNSSELGLLCTVPTESVPDFELRRERKFPMIASRLDSESIPIGHVVDGKRELEHMSFALSEEDLNKHTFVCGITGNGKTTTVKKILVESKRPFLVIESAKKEYRNLQETEVYTLGRPEIRAPQMNPFYIMPGVNPQVHIDYLKDLFNASFSFYGPMPYILEKCLHAVYKNKGWDLTLGYHPLLAKVESKNDFFNIDHIKKQYSNESHRFLFPTMQDLKDEINRYVDEELKYDGEVAGNVKTAMKVRLENLCVGAKGYTFNTANFLDFEELFRKKTVFELEGLADDSDKAFGVGLLVIFINEYRQTEKEIHGIHKRGLQHLLVIEEAHRLLKNIDTERFSESVGNPKGKAVEHFTNMIAEMRSYGQGVIVAEQIPTKLAPDVIKNSSTKIVHRIVSADDQRVIANTIGILEEDAIQLGSLETGYAYAHKEGMAFPTPIKVLDCFMSDGKKRALDVFVSDELLYNKNVEGFTEINLSMIRNFFAENRQIKQQVLALLNTLMVEEEETCVQAIRSVLEFVKREIRKNDVPLLFSEHKEFHLYAKFLTEMFLLWMVRGVYCAKMLPDNEFLESLESLFYAPTPEKIKKLKENLQTLYGKDLSKYAKASVTALIDRSLRENTDISGTIREYFIFVSDKVGEEIEAMLKGGLKN